MAKDFERQAATLHNHQLKKQLTSKKESLSVKWGRTMAGFKPEDMELNEEQKLFSLKEN